MDKFPRGTIPPTVYVAARGTREAAAAPPSTIAHTATQATAPAGTCDLASTCPSCNVLMQPEHAHYRCPTCGYRDSCCF
jgi:hypothetical protein